MHNVPNMDTTWLNAINDLGFPLSWELSWLKFFYVCAHVSALEQVKNIHKYATKNVFKFDVVVGSTLDLVIDGNLAILSFPWE